MHTSNISARRFAEFFDSIPAAVFRTTVEGKIVYCNRTFAHTFGFDSAIDLIDYPVIELYQNKKDRGVLVHSIMQRGRLTDLPIAFKKKDGTPIWCAITARAVLDDDGMIINLDGTLKDITEEIDTQRTGSATNLTILLFFSACKENSLTSTRTVPICSGCPKSSWSENR